MSQTRAKSPARAGMKWLAQQLVRKDMAASRCASRPDLPWTSNVQPDRKMMLRMEEVCAGCPVQNRCARIGVDALGGMYAGVWLPWKDEKGFPGVRTARGVLRARVDALSAEMAI